MRTTSALKRLASAAFCVAAMTACSSSTASKQTGVVEGRFAAVGGPLGAPAIGLAGSVTATPVTWGTPSTAHADHDGRYRIRLSPGSYTLKGSSPTYNEGASVCRADTPALVRAGLTTSADILCQRR